MTTARGSHTTRLTLHSARKSTVVVVVVVEIKTPLRFLTRHNLTHRGVPDNITGIITLSSPIYGCTPIQPPANTSLINIAVIARSVGPQSSRCSFANKTHAAQLAGYNAVIIYNYDDTALFSMSDDGLTSNITIPAVMVSFSTGEALANATGSLVTVSTSTATISNMTWIVMGGAAVVTGILVLVVVYTVIRVRYEMRRDPHNPDHWGLAAELRRVEPAPLRPPPELPTTPWPAGKTAS